MSLRMNTRIDAQTKVSYATEEETYQAYSLDCGEGINTIMVSAHVQAAMDALTLEMVRNYPHSPALKQHIADYWRNHASLDTNRIVLTDGSIAGLYLLNRLFLVSDSRVLGISPQFSEYVTDALMYCAYDAVPLRSENAYRFEVAEFLGALLPAHTLIYLDNPNNPTGQVIPLAAIDRILRKAKEQDTAVIVDEAYGEYMPQSASAMRLINEYDNLIVLRTFSKGYGLAGLRAGYLAAPTQLMAPLNNIINPYCVNAWARSLAEACLEDSAFPEELRRRTAVLKRALLSLPLNNLQFAHTCEAVSISLLIHRDQNFNLAEAFRQRGIFVISGFSFQGLNENAVRLRIPREHELERLVAAILEIDAL